jgi:hypothetical protein
MRAAYPLIASGLLLASTAAHANYLLVTASGVVTSSNDATNYLGFGLGPKGDGRDSLAGQTATLTFMLNLDLAAADVFGGTQPGRALYLGGSCPTVEGNWIQTLDVSVGGSSLSVLQPGSGLTSQCDSADISDKAGNGRFDAFSVQDQEETRTSFPGSTPGESSFTDLSRFVSLGILDDIDFVHGVGLDQALTWNFTGDQGLGSAGFGFVLASGSCDALGNCTSSNALNLDGSIDIRSLTAQVINVPEPAMLGLLGLGLFATFAVTRRSRDLR